MERGGFGRPFFMHTQESEKDKYTETWNTAWYRQNSPALRDFRRIVAWAEKYNIQHILDFGCGSGKVDLALNDKGYSVRMLDIADNCLDRATKDALSASLTFETACLWDERVSQIRGDGVICIDVLEHLPEDKVDAVVDNILCAAPHGYCNAALFPHRYQGKELHLTLKPASWWFAKFPDARQSTNGKHAVMVW